MLIARQAQRETFDRRNAGRDTRHAKNRRPGQEREAPVPPAEAKNFPIDAPIHHRRGLRVRRHVLEDDMGIFAMVVELGRGNRVADDGSVPRQKPALPDVVFKKPDRRIGFGSIADIEPRPAPCRPAG